MEYVDCTLCGSDEWAIRYPATDNSSEQPEVEAFRCTHSGYGSHTQIVQCRQCGHVFSNPRWMAEELLDAYSAVEDETYVMERSGRERTFKRHLQVLEKWAGPGRGRHLLDVGAYIGVFIEVARSHGWDAVGIEPSQWAAGIGQSKNLPIIEGTLGAPELRNRRFDVITMWDVIEHLDDPSAELAKIYELLNPGGVLAVHTMDIESTAAKSMGSRWPWLMDMHIHYFSRKTLAEILEQSGYEMLWVGPQGRYLSLGYIASRVAGLSQELGRSMGWLVEKSGIAEITVPINLRDLITAYARKPG